MTIITRFPPSPTGKLHIGNVRTALFNYLFAKANNGEFVLRIEDTDKVRSTQEAVQTIFDALNWLGLEYDNKNDVVYQSQRVDRHLEIARQLLEDGKAYYCYCSPEELEKMREEHGGYNGYWRERTDTPPDGVKPVIRLKTPMEGELHILDQVQGNVSVEASQIDDYILVRSDNSPTYMLSVVVDDHDMKVTHILRGNDHLNNAFRQKALYDAMGWDVPIMAHLPLIIGKDGAKYSKRHGAVGVSDFKDMGILPEALLNMLMRLGWSHGDEEIISLDQASKWFSLDHVNKSDARFDQDKLMFLNAHYIRALSKEDFLEKITQGWTQLGYRYEGHDQLRLIPLIGEFKDRAETLKQLAEDSAFLIDSELFRYDDEAVEKIKSTGPELLQNLAKALSKISKAGEEDIKDLLKQFAKDHCNGKMGAVGMPLRAALVGRLNSPNIFLTTAAMGQGLVTKRLNMALQQL